MYRHYRSGTIWASLALTVAVVVAAPQSPEPAATAAAAVASADDVVYDQRQNGTENVRISLSDLKVVLAPADGLFQIMSMAGAQLLNSELANSVSDMQRPTAFECTGLKCNNRNRQTAKTNRFKLSSIIAPLLQQNNNQAAEQKHAAGAAESNSNSINK